MHRRFLISVAASFVVAAVAGQASADKVQTLILEEQRIEGKIRRPQMVLIKADQRPDFEPIVVHSVGVDADIAKAVTPSVLEKSPYKGAFSFQNRKITNYSP
jgi:hypothetical protein